MGRREILEIWASGEAVFLRQREKWILGFGMDKMVMTGKLLITIKEPLNYPDNGKYLRSLDRTNSLFFRFRHDVDIAQGFVPNIQNIMFRTGRAICCETFCQL